MVDATVREHERRWRETGAPDDMARWLVARLRAGELTPERLELAACLGSRAARAALGGRVRAWDPPTDDPRAWLMALVAWGDEVLVRGLALALASMRERSSVGDVHPVLGAVLAWCDDPTTERARAAATSPYLGPVEPALAGYAPHDHLVNDLARALEATSTTRHRVLAASLAGWDVVDLSHWLAFEARRLLREWALDLPPEARTNLPPVPDAAQVERALASHHASLRGGPLGWLPGAAAPAPQAEQLIPFHASGWLRRTRVLDVLASGVDLLHVSLPGARRHHGLLLLDADGAVWPLDHRHPEHLDRLLELEGELPDDLDPADLAALVAEALVARRNDSVRVIRAAEDLERPDYVVDRRASASYQGVLAAPALERDGAAWSLGFVCLSGWMHETQRLTRVLVRKRPGQRTTNESQVLCKRVYSRTPGIRY